jgi:hypothetical protein
LSLARLHLKELNNPAAAKALLLACADELPFADERRCATWTKLLEACDERGA